MTRRTDGMIGRLRERSRSPGHLVTLSPCHLVIFLPLLAVLGCGHGEAKPRRGSVERLPRLTVVQPIRGELSRTTELAAQVEALKRVDLAARVPGIVAFL